jgi:hypothetical protein
MFAAMQDASFAAWDAVVASEFNDDLPTYPPTYIHEQAWKAALDAAPEAPSAEPVAWRISGRFGWTYQEEPPYESQRGRVAEPLYQHPQADHREVMKLEHQRNNLLIIMQQALDALKQSRPLTSEDDFVLLVRQHQQAIIALRAALGERTDG